MMAVIELATNGMPLNPKKPLEGYAFEMRPVRWKPYKPQGAKQTGRPGRWQELNEYGGWENCETPGELHDGPEMVPASRLTEAQAEIERLRDALQAIAGPTAMAMDARDRVEAYRDVAKEALNANR